MILRQFCARHGRSALSQSRSCWRTYASETNPEPLVLHSERDGQLRRRIQGHPDDPSSILDTSDRAPTAITRHVENTLNALTKDTQAIEASLNAHISSRILQLPDLQVPSTTSEVATQLESSKRPPAPFSDLPEFYDHLEKQRKLSREGTLVTQTYNPLTILQSPPSPSELTLPMLLANQTHLGHHTSLWHPGNSGYIFGIRDGIHIISLDTTFAYLRRAAKVVQEVARRGGIILFVGTRKGEDEITVSAAKLAKGYHIFDRWVPGSLTNGQQILGGCAIKVVDLMDEEIPHWRKKLAESDHPVLKPDLVICLNPLENEVCLHECGLHNVPTIGIIDTDVNPTWVTYPIPANDDSLRSVALIAGCLGRAGQEGQRLRLELAMKKGQASYDTSEVLRKLAEIGEGANKGADSQGSEMLPLEQEAARVHGRARANAR